MLFDSLFAPLASAPPDPSTRINCSVGTTEQSCPQVAGLVSVTNSAVLQANLPASGFSCPSGHGTSGNNGSCRTFSVPLLDNNVIWQNRSFVINVGGKGTGTQSLQKVVSLYNSSFTGLASTAAGSQATIGTCPTASYWDIGVRGDSGPTNHAGGRILGPAFSVLTSTTGYAASNTNGSPALIRQYCNGSRVPPGAGGLGWEVPPGTNETNGLPTPVFTLTPSATVDEGNNWINLRWGPLALADPATPTVLGNYGLTSTSLAINHIPSSSGDAYSLAPSLDYFGNQRKTNNAVDAGAVEFAGGTTVNAVGSVTGGPLAFGNVPLFSTAPAQTLTLHSTGTASLTGITLAFSSPRYFRPTGAAGGTCGGTLVAGATCTINVRFRPTALGLVNGTLTITSNVAITGSPVSLSGTGVASGLAISPDPLTITASGGALTSGTGTVTLTNNGASSFNVTSVVVSGGSVIDYFFTQSGTNTCSGALAPGASCSVGVRFTRVLVGTGDYPGTITFTDTATGSPHTGDLIGHAN